MTSTMNSAEDDPRAQLAVGLAALRAAVGGPSYRDLHLLLKAVRKVPVSAGTLRNAEKNIGMPKLATVIQFVTACRHVAENNDLGLDPSLFAPDTWTGLWRKINAPVDTALEVEIAVTKSVAREDDIDMARWSAQLSDDRDVSGPVHPLPEVTDPSVLEVHRPILVDEEVRDDSQQVNAVGALGIVDATARHHETALPLPEPITTSLPSAPRAFVGRGPELRQILDSAARERVVSIHAIDGMAGIGKTALAIRAAHDLAGRFPDGQYFIELHAHTPGQPAADPSEVLAGLLIELGLNPHNIPDTLTGRRDLWRHRLANRKVLVVLDDAASRSQVEPLLPSGPDCLALITSRHRLLLLPDMRPLPLEVLDPQAATDLFLTVAHRDSKDDGERHVAMRIAEVCGYLPLAIGLVAGRVAHRPGWTAAEIGELAEEFAAATDRLTAVDTADDPVVRAGFDLSYRDLPSQRQLLFRRLGLHPGPDLDAYVAAAVAGIDLATARRELDALYTDHLLDETARGRYRMHDLLRDYAHSVTFHDSTTNNTWAVNQLLDYYQHTATHADRWLTVRTRPADDKAAIPAGGTAGGVVVRDFGDQSQALAWMRAERANLLACVELTAGRDPARMVALTAAMAGLLDREGPWTLAARLHHRAANTAHRLSDRLEEANALSEIAYAGWFSNNIKETAELHQRALALYRVLGNRLGQANSLNGLGWARREEGNTGLAIDLYQRALTLYRDIGDGLGEGMVLNNLGRLRRFTGDNEQAADLYQQALTLYCDLNNSQGQAHALVNLGSLRADTGDREQAADLYQQALTLYRGVGDRQSQSLPLTGLAEMHYETGDYSQAAELVREALALDRDIGNRNWEALDLRLLGAVCLATGDNGQAAEMFQAALAIHREAGYRLGDAEELNRLGQLLLAASEPGQALTAFADALELAREAGSQLEQARALEGAGRCRAGLGDNPAAVSDLSAAVAIYRRIGAPEADSAAGHLAELEANPSQG
ncbi:ATP-binding protein [Nocardia pseudovaccinii]|uniref:ATP-binding protein n=1 Tax=Nocardia pseudovaccinii TaxID=189540 RepID=UPI000B2484DC|nr:tetratricopeptide repeat protein [Nocardia pseudovaccinii]